jgi:hypothetical protein
MAGTAPHPPRRHDFFFPAGPVILEVDVPRRWLRRSKRGLGYCPRDIPPERIRGVVTFAALARSPVEETAKSRRKDRMLGPYVLLRRLG